MYIRPSFILNACLEDTGKNSSFSGENAFPCIYADVAKHRLLAFSLVFVAALCIHCLDIPTTETVLTTNHYANILGVCLP